MCIAISAAAASVVTAVTSALSSAGGTAALSVISAAAGTAVSRQQANAQRKTAAFQAEQAKKQAQKAEMEAAYERQQGIENARKEKLNAILKTGDARARIAAGNIAMSSDLVLNLENETKLNSELDALDTQADAERRAQGYMDKRNSLYQNAALTDFNSKLQMQNYYANLGLGMVNLAQSKLISK